MTLRQVITLYLTISQDILTQFLQSVPAHDIQINMLHFLVLHLHDSDHLLVRTSLGSH